MFMARNTVYYNDNKKFHKNGKKTWKESRGDWEFSFFQKVVSPKDVIHNEEQIIKLNLRPENSFDPKLIHNYINPQLSKEELLIKKYENNEKISKTEKIIIDNVLRKQASILEEDYKLLQKYGLNAKPQTKEGRTKLLLLTLQHFISVSNNESICNIFLRLLEDQFKITDALKSEFSKSLLKMEEVVSKSDLIELQFVKLYEQMPPLNTKGFKTFDPWQINVIKNIDLNKSTIVCAPTSAGKTVLSGYATTKGKTLIVVPTDPLAWQMASYIGGILNVDIPIITRTYQTIPRRDEMVKLINSSNAIVGTADIIVDYLPLINVKFDWIIYDEIHMIGKTKSKEMEHIAKVFDNVPFIALSATIGNIEHFTQWFKSLNPNKEVENIVCNKRFFNLQRCYYNSSKNELEMLHPFSLISINDFKDKSILTKNLQPSPPDIWALYNKIKQYYGDIGQLSHKKYFGLRERIELNKANEYFSELIKFLIENYNEEHINNIISSFKNNDLNNEPVDLMNLGLLLKKENKTPAIIFQKNTSSCLRLVRELAKQIDNAENEKYPKLLALRMKENKKIDKQLDKQVEPKPVENKDVKNDKEKKNGDSKKDMKKFLESTVNSNEVQPCSLQEPTAEFNFNNEQYFTEGIVENWVKLLKKYFPSYCGEYHFIIKLLWRGIGIYASGLPDAYLRIVQQLATKKQLALVFSDMSLVFGVSMPFRTVVIYRDAYVSDDLDAMIFHQMSGRAGRRGLDKKGYVIFAGFSWKRIVELSVCPIPNVSGIDNLNYVVPHANRLSIKHNNNLDWNKTFKNCLDGSSNEDNMETLIDINSNYTSETGWNFAFNDDVNHLHMMWVLRELADEPIIISLILSHLKKGFESLYFNSEKNQVDCAHFLSYFINKKECNNKEYMLPECSIFSQPSFGKIFDSLKRLELNHSKEIDGRVFLSIKNNNLFKCTTEAESDYVRQNLFDFANNVKAIQHYCFHSKHTNLAKLLGKLLTRIWWIYHTSSPIMKQFNEFDVNEFEEFNNTSYEESDED